jgi:glycerophosphoryl diester phosphodiesterase
LLEEVFDALGRKTFINLEFKNYGAFGDLLVERVCELVQKCGVEDRVLFSSFSVRSLKKARELLSNVPRGLLAFPHLAGAWARSFAFSFGEYAALHPSVGDVDPAEAQRVHRLKRLINVWTVNQPVDIRHLMNWGVDGIITDDPALALKVLGRSS